MGLYLLPIRDSIAVDVAQIQSISITRNPENLVVGFRNDVQLTIAHEPEHGVDVYKIFDELLEAGK